MKASNSWLFNVERNVLIEKKKKPSKNVHFKASAIVIRKKP